MLKQLPESEVLAGKKRTLSLLQDRSKQIGFPFFLIVVYLFMEYARPANPMHIPMVLSTILLLNWVFIAKKVWNRQIICLLILLAIIAVMGPFAINNYSVFWGFIKCPCSSSAFVSQ